jgi:hypothetical protein
LIESLPLDDASVEVVIYNGVIDLVPDKDAVFDEIDRVLQLRSDGSHDRGDEADANVRGVAAARGARHTTMARALSRAEDPETHLLVNGQRR